MWIYLLYR